MNEDGAMIERILAARVRVSRLRLVLGLFVLGLFVYFGFQIRGPFVRLNEEALMRHLNARAGTQVWPIISDEMNRVAEKVTPVLANTLADRLSADMPNLEKALETETERLGTNLKTLSEKTMEILGTEISIKARERVLKAFPELTADDPRVARLSAAISDRIRGWALAQMVATIELNVTAMLQIKETLKAYRPKGAGASNVTAEDLLELTIEVMNVKLEGGGKPMAAVATKKAGAPK